MTATTLDPASDADGTLFTAMLNEMNGDIAVTYKDCSNLNFDSQILLWEYDVRDD